ncbi:ATP-dependent RNA helicase mrh-4, mitochondrial [Xylaria nigripes]|nr:ATP-dependent RNA helicase mrh-4, mitochondrial [Xylaria nigripes]
MMSAITTKPICPSCFFTITTRVLYQNARQGQLWAARRLYSGGKRTTPSRMVLSKRVALPPSRRDGDSKDRRGFDRRSVGPFGGMNQTVARIREDKRRPQHSSRQDSYKKPAQDYGSRRVKAMKMQSSLTSISYGQRARTKAGVVDLDSFDKLDLLPELKSAVAEDALKGMVNTKPTPIQRLAIPALLGTVTSRRQSKSGTTGSGRQEFLLAAETGSGKTLAYLLPAINAMKKAEAADDDIRSYRAAFEAQRAAMQEPGYQGPREFDPHPTSARPRVIVLVPTAELVDQITAVAKSLSHMGKFKVSSFSASVSPIVIHNNMYSPRGIDMVVATPHLLASMANSDPNILSRVSHLIIDEADSLFDRSFSPVTLSILDRALPSVKQLILCSATIPQRLDKYLVKDFPNMLRITTPNLHAIPRRVQLGVIDVTKDLFRNNKDLACADAIWAIGREAADHGEPSSPTDLKRIMVFVNEREKTQEVANYLVSKGIDAVALHRDTEEQRQSEMLTSFTTNERSTLQAPAPAPATAPAPAPELSRPSEGLSKKRLTNTKVIVATDLASRGIDTLAVRHVILYDVPHTTIDFIHRLGRAGRMGKRGRGIVLVGKTDRRDIVAEVRESMFMGQALI